MELANEIIRLILNVALVVFIIGWLVYFSKEYSRKQTIKINQKDINNIVDELERRQYIKSATRKR